MEHDKSHGSPYDRGSADRYYQRMFNPHYYIHGETSQRIEESGMSEEQIKAYSFGYAEEEDRKDYGNNKRGKN